MSVTKKHTWEPVTDISLEADKSPEDCWNNSEQRRAPSKGGPARGTPGTGSKEAAPRRPRLQGRTPWLGKEHCALSLWEGRCHSPRGGTVSVEGHGTCPWPKVCAEQSLGAASLSGPRWTRLSPPGRRAGQSGATGSTCSTFSKTAQAPCSHKPEMSQKFQDSAVQTAHFRWTLKRTQNSCQQLVPANAGGGHGALARPRASCVPGRAWQQPLRSHPSPA